MAGGSDRGVVEEIKFALGDARKLCEALGLIRKGAKRQAQGLIIHCPAHEESTPSCSVRSVGGIVFVKCHGCGFTADALSLIAVARGFDPRLDFRRALVEGAEIAGLHSLVDDMRDGTVSESRPPPPRPPPEPERDYPPRDEVRALWGSCKSVDSDPAVASWLKSRRLDPNRVAGSDCARALGRSCPSWAKYRGQLWRDTGHRLIFPMFDASGEMRSVRGGRVLDGDSPKRLPPGGHRASGLVMACPLAQAMLAGTWKPERVVVLEGEPDFLEWATRTGIAAHARLGITSGSWTPEIAAKIPNMSTVFVVSDRDEAGDRYAREIKSSLFPRCELKRLRAISIPENASAT